jgi:hypothetical protein
MNSAIRATGTASSMAMVALITVPNSSAAAAKAGGFASGNHSVLVKNGTELACSAGIAFQMRKAPMVAMMTSTSTPAPREIPRKTRSPSRRAPPVEPGPAGASGASRVELIPASRGSEGDQRGS